MIEVSNVIAGGRRRTATATTDLVDPSTGEVFAVAPNSRQTEVDAAYAAADAAFPAWRDATPSVRQRALLRIADLIESHAEDLVALESQNTGKPVAITMSEEIPPMVDQIRFFGGAARVLEGRSAGEYMEGFTSFVRREPVGVVGQVAPWNYPLMMAVWKFAPAIAAGNTVVLKPSDTTPVSTTCLAQMISEAEILPKGVLNVVCGDRDTGRLVVSHARADMVAITGSVRAGTEVAEAAAASLKRVHLELGGKAPVVVFDDADATKAAEWLVIAGFFNAGQDCTAATRVLCQAGIHDTFVEALADQARGVKTTYANGPADPDAFMPPVNNDAQVRKIMGFLDRRPAHAEVVVGGDRPGPRGCFINPTIVCGLQQTDEMIQHEVFGPVMTVQRFDTEAEAISLANGVDYGLASSVWTTDHARAMRVSRALDFGTVWINTHIPLVAEMPHGGFKRSGYGKDLSLYGIEDYTRIKHVMSAIGD